MAPATETDSPALLDLLACPKDHAPLVQVEGGLECSECGHAFDVTDGVPNMLVDD